MTKRTTPCAIFRPQRIVSGGQTGADLAALDVALELGIEHGGWVPKGRKNEAGRIDVRYENLRESESTYPAERTALNVRDSDATMIVSHGPLRGGSRRTRREAERQSRRWLHVDLSAGEPAASAAIVRRWLAVVRPSTLNVAGPRALQDPRIYQAVRRLLSAVLDEPR